MNTIKRIHTVSITEVSSNDPTSSTISICEYLSHHYITYTPTCTCEVVLVQG